jgi:hypothetical protein
MFTYGDLVHCPMVSWLLEKSDGNLILQNTDEYDRFGIYLRDSLGFKIDTTLSNPSLMLRKIYNVAIRATTKGGLSVSK